MFKLSCQSSVGLIFRFNGSSVFLSCVILSTRREKHYSFLADNQLSLARNVVAEV